MDIRPFSKGGVLQQVSISDPQYDAEMTRRLVLLIKQKFPNSVILFNDRALINEGLTSFKANHDNHLHWLIK